MRGSGFGGRHPLRWSLVGAVLIPLAGALAWTALPLLHAPLRILLEVSVGVGLAWFLVQLGTASRR